MFARSHSKEIIRHAETDLFFKGTDRGEMGIVDLVIEVFNTCTENEEDVEAGISKYISFCIMTLKSAILITKGFFLPIWERVRNLEKCSKRYTGATKSKQFQPVLDCFRSEYKSMNFESEAEKHLQRY